ncbi:PIN domain-containing protein [Ruminiclostridium hungatei]
MATKIIGFVGGFIDKVENGIQSITLSEMLLGALGLIVGLIVANLISIPIIKIQIIGVPFAVIINILFSLTGIGLSLRKRNENFFDLFKESKASPNIPKIIDTSTIIDGRILDICSAGFIDGELIVPSFVLEELRHIADSEDSLRRARGRRGLDILNLLQKDSSHTVKIEEFDYSNIEADEMLMKASLKLKGKLVTIDYNLSKVAALKGIKVLNINELANAVKPIALPGEEMSVQVVKDGKEAGQGVAFLEDGTMIVIEGGKKFLGETIPVMVTSVLQTSAGRMVFAKPAR